MGEESDPSHPCPIPAAHSTPFDPAAVWLVCLFMTLCGSLCDFDCLQVKCEGSNGVLRVAEVGQGWDGAVQDERRDGKGWKHA